MEWIFGEPDRRRFAVELEMKTKTIYYFTTALAGWLVYRHVLATAFVHLNELLTETLAIDDVDAICILSDLAFMRDVVCLAVDALAVANFKLHRRLIFISAALCCWRCHRKQ